MTIWGLIIGGTAGLAVGGPISALLGAAAALTPAPPAAEAPHDRGNELMDVPKAGAYTLNPTTMPTR